MRPKDFDSTLIRRGRKAATFADMVAFAQSVHERPFARLLEELPQLARLSDTKFNLATRVLRRRFQSEPEINQAELRQLGAEVADRASSDWIAGRIRAIFEFDGD
ncbi:MAG TPA: hypothetical protein VNA04_16245 [Thermoanaerobaculia bacterium]|nr:hypothetical protein [Thermoanaerobaculia bacterium]